MEQQGRVAGIVLASGMSTRFGSPNKLLVSFRGEPVVRRTVRAYVDSGLDSIVVVTGHDAEAVETALAGLPVLTINNPDFREGQSRALVLGVRSTENSAAAAIIGVADQPHLDGEVIRKLITLYRRSRPRLVVPRYAGSRGNPVIFDRSLFSELLEAEGDVGGRHVIERHVDEIAWLDVPDGHIGGDIDTQGDYQRLLGGENT
jgi:molybdenum cofactor cytidylyltransferase